MKSKSTFNPSMEIVRLFQKEKEKEKIHIQSLSALSIDAIESSSLYVHMIDQYVLQSLENIMHNHVKLSSHSKDIVIEKAMCT